MDKGAKGMRIPVMGADRIDTGSVSSGMAILELALLQ